VKLSDFHVSSFFKEMFPETAQAFVLYHAVLQK